MPLKYQKIEKISLGYDNLVNAIQPYKLTELVEGAAHQLHGDSNKDKSSVFVKTLRIIGRDYHLYYGQNDDLPVLEIYIDNDGSTTPDNPNFKEKDVAVLKTLELKIDDELRKISNK